MTDQDLLTDLQYALIEPPDGGASWPSGTWTRTEVLDAVTAAMTELTKQTHALVGRADLAVLANATAVTLPSDWLATAGAVWRSAANARTPLGPADAFEADTALPGWETTTSTPIAYADRDRASQTLRLIPTPAADGTLELLYIVRPADVLGAGATLVTPDVCTSAVKYGALAALLRALGRLQDTARARYCDRRVQLTTIATDLLLRGGM